MIGLLQAPLLLCARHGRLVLVLGLLTGVFLPQVALPIREWLPALVTLLLFVAAFRIGPKQALGSLADVRASLTFAIVLQVIVPCAVASAFLFGGISGSLALAVVLVTSVSTISGSPNLTILTGNDPAPALRILVLGTAILPLTVIPVFWLEPSFGSALQVAEASGRLLVVIAASGGVAFLLRHYFLPSPSTQALSAIDGVSAVLMAVLVIGLMSAVGPALFGDPLKLSMVLALVFAVNFTLQIVTNVVLRKQIPADDLPAFSICAGNRNMALFIVALPRELTDPLLLFIGCYQIPMYLTPILLGWLYRKDSRSA